MIAVGGVLLLAVATSPVRVVRIVDDGCPSGAEVDLALASMLTTASGAAPAGQDVAKLERRANKLRVELTDPDGVVIAERTLDGNASCAQLGGMAAIVIASWESDVHPEFVRQPAEIVRVERAPPVERPAAPPPPAASYDVAAGITFGQADTVAAGASIGGDWFPRGAGPGLSLVGAGDLARTIAVGTHEARWQRWTASLELAWRWAARDRLVIDPHGGVTVGWLSTEGVDYAQNASASAVSLGATAGIRTAWWIWRRAALWIDVRGTYFPRRDSIYGTGAATVDETTAPSWGGFASVGVAVGRAPLSR